MLLAKRRFACGPLCTVDEEPDLTETETSLEYVPREIELLCLADPSGSSSDSLDEGGSDETCTTAARLPQGSLRNLSGFLGRPRETIKRSDSWIVRSGRTLASLPWFETEFARAVLFCFLVFVAGPGNYLLYPVLLVSGYFSPDTATRKQRRHATEVVNR